LNHVFIRNQLRYYALLEAKLGKLSEADPLFAMNFHVFLVHHGEMLEKLSESLLIPHECDIYLLVLIEVLNLLPLGLLIPMLILVLYYVRDYFGLDFLVLLLLELLHILLSLVSLLYLLPPLLKLSPQLLFLLLKELLLPLRPLLLLLHFYLLVYFRLDLLLFGLLGLNFLKLFPLRLVLLPQKRPINLLLALLFALFLFLFSLLLFLKLRLLNFLPLDVLFELLVALLADLFPLLLDEAVLPLAGFLFFLGFVFGFMIVSRFWMRGEGGVASFDQSLK
jgi:hypothetical protein